jgi:hypothetical protein
MHGETVKLLVFEFFTLYLISTNTTGMPQLKTMSNLLQENLIFQTVREVKEILKRIKTEITDVST